MPCQVIVLKATSRVEDGQRNLALRFHSRIKSEISTVDTIGTSNQNVIELDLGCEKELRF